ncbi:hydrogenase nickel incorporation protein HypB [Pseudodesulfovibrio thermohalotolerans]|uniref:hydrogenase nickel incorporation protein HypB n=1 Tax=Pseudodesulfovibrio thermohalotolerans TaxID=2880651 RepID=UPI002442BCA4|nr:hydrogenase nickel incorporation protein HypB [Pseudodesulfovibrio thermohalotolerans]WFS62074.1 hydrogenase nickel incorporation protein HypB [Pseudodesulfovibrio thermohalotolerans]
MSKEVTIVRNVLEANDRLADELQKKFRVKKILCLNLMSSPGAGKTTLLERTLTDLKDEFKMAVIEGDLQTDNDAQRVAATGAQAVQINTEGGCHLDSGMVMDALKAIDTDDLDILFVENVGNLVCPAEFNVGEDYKVTLLSVAEGDDKPEKYPFMFHISAVMLLNKVDLLPYVDFDLQKAENHAKKLNKDIEVMPISARTGDNMEQWYEWLRKKRAEKL